MASLLPKCQLYFLEKTRPHGGSSSLEPFFETVFSIDIFSRKNKFFGLFMKREEKNSPSLPHTLTFAVTSVFARDDLSVPNLDRSSLALLTVNPPLKGDVWELYNVDEDFSQAENLAAKIPEKLKELQALFEPLRWTAKVLSNNP